MWFRRFVKQKAVFVFNHIRNCTYNEIVFGLLTVGFDRDRIIAVCHGKRSTGAIYSIEVIKIIECTSNCIFHIVQISHNESEFIVIAYIVIV